MLIHELLMGFHTVGIDSQHDRTFFLNLRVHIPEAAGLTGATRSHVGRIEVKDYFFAKIVRKTVHFSCVIRQ